MINNERKKNMKNVLVVDDTKPILKMAKFVLGDLYNVYLSNSGELALEILECKPIDIVLMDVNMPGLDGMDTVRRIRKMKNIKDIPVIFFTALSSKEIIDNCMQLGMKDYIIKPYEPDVLLKKLEAVLAKSTYVAPENGNNQEYEI